MRGVLLLSIVVRFYRENSGNPPHDQTLRVILYEPSGFRDEPCTDMEKKTQRAPCADIWVNTTGRPLCYCAFPLREVYMRETHRRAESEALLSVFSNTRESRAQIVGRPGTDRPHAGTRGESTHHFFGVGCQLPLSGRSSLNVPSKYWPAALLV